MLKFTKRVFTLICILVLSQLASPIAVIGLPVTEISVKEAMEQTGSGESMLALNTVEVITDGSIIKPNKSIKYTLRLVEPDKSKRYTMRMIEP